MNALLRVRLMVLGAGMAGLVCLGALALWPLYREYRAAGRALVRLEGEAERVAADLRAFTRLSRSVPRSLAEVVALEERLRRGRDFALFLRQLELEAVRSQAAIERVQPGEARVENGLRVVPVRLTLQVDLDAVRVLLQRVEAMPYAVRVTGVTLTAPGRTPPASIDLEVLST